MLVASLANPANNSEGNLALAKKTFSFRLDGKTVEV